MLLNEYFRIISQTATDSVTTFHVLLLADHPVYRGHFPGNPVSPGVCNMQMIKECAEQLIGHEVLLDNVRQYRLMEVLSPQRTPELDIDVEVGLSDGRYQIRSTVRSTNGISIDFKAEAAEMPAS